jgi:hypothetical protein
VIDPELKARRDRLETEFDKLIAISDLRAKQTHWVAIYLMIIALGCGAVAGAGGLGEFLPQKVLGVLALFPPAIAIAVSQFKPQARSGWHYRKSDGLNALRSRLMYQLPIEPNADQIAAIAKAKDDLIERMQVEWDNEFQFTWTAFSVPPAHPPARQADSLQNS